MARQDNEDPPVDVATRIGNLAMFFYSVVAVVAGTLLPQLTKRDPRLLQSPPGEAEETEFTRIQETITRWKKEAVSRKKKLVLPQMPVVLRDVWSFGLILYGVITLATFFINTVVTVGSFSVFPTCRFG
jgi:solute carrier family 45 protein 1/2/4